MLQQLGRNLCRGMSRGFDGFPFPAADEQAMTSEVQQVLSNRSVRRTFSGLVQDQ